MQYDTYNSSRLAFRGKIKFEKDVQAFIDTKVKI